VYINNKIAEAYTSFSGRQPVYVGVHVFSSSMLGHGYLLEEYDVLLRYSFVMYLKTRSYIDIFNMLIYD
jgi:hypothetical protein